MADGPKNCCGEEWPKICKETTGINGPKVCKQRRVRGKGKVGWKMEGAQGGSCKKIVAGNSTKSCVLLLSLQ